MRHSMRRLQRRDDPFCFGERAKSRQRLIVSRVIVFRAADVAKITVLRPDRRVVESCRNRMCQFDLSVIVRQQPGLCALQYAKLASLEARRMPVRG